MDEIKKRTEFWLTIKNRIFLRQIVEEKDIKIKHLGDLIMDFIRKNKKDFYQFVDKSKKRG